MLAASKPILLGPRNSHTPVRVKEYDLVVLPVVSNKMPLAIPAWVEHPYQLLGPGRRKSEEIRRQSVLMTSGRAYTISGILSHQVLLSGIIFLAR